MTAPKSPPMEPETFFLRVFSVKQERGGPESSNPTPISWEVRADGGHDGQRASLFYTEANPQSLPPVDSLIRVSVDAKLTNDESPHPPIE